MKSKFITLFSVSLILSLGSLSTYIAAIRGQNFWTDEQHKLSLIASREYLELYLNKIPLEEPLKNGRVYLIQEGNHKLLSESDVEVRINRAAQLNRVQLIITSIAFVTLIYSAVMIIYELIIKSKQKVPAGELHV